MAEKAYVAPPQTIPDYEVTKLPYKFFPTEQEYAGTLPRNFHAYNTSNTGAGATIYTAPDDTDAYLTGLQFTLYGIGGIVGSMVLAHIDVNGNKIASLSIYNKATGGDHAEIINTFTMPVLIPRGKTVSITWTSWANGTLAVASLVGYLRSPVDFVFK